MKTNVRPRQFIPLLVWAMFVASTMAYAGSTITLTTTGGGQKTYDLVDPVARAEFLEAFGHSSSVPPCKKKADYVVKLLKERDAGVTKEEHLQKVRDQYEKTKLEPEGAIPWHVYIDFGRMVRDVHRSSGSGTGQYNRIDADELWGHEFTGCISAR